MEWTSITTAISLDVIAICGIVITLIYWRRGSAVQAPPAAQVSSSTWSRVERAMTWVSFVLLIVLIGVLTISPKALAVIEPKEDVSIDFSLLATIFGILVTLLVTWQIYSTIVAKEQVESLSKKYDDLKNEVLKLGNGSRNVILGWNQYSLGEIMLNDGTLWGAYECFINALKLFSDSTLELNDEVIEDCFSNMDLCIDNVVDTDRDRSRENFYAHYADFDLENDNLFISVSGTDRISRGFKVHLMHLQRRRLGIRNLEPYFGHGNENIDGESISENERRNRLLRMVVEKENRLGTTHNRQRL